LTYKLQVDKFKEPACHLDADEHEAAFEGAQTKVVHGPKLPDDDAAANAGESRLPRN
jgi:hypothetical protein